LCSQALDIIDEVGDLIRLRYSKMPVPDFSEKDIPLIEVQSQYQDGKHVLRSMLKMQLMLSFKKRSDIL